MGEPGTEVGVRRRLVVLAAVFGLLVGVSAAVALVANQHSPTAPAAAASDRTIDAAANSAAVETTIAPGVAPLRHLAQPDLLVTTDRPLSRAKVAALRKAVHARGITVVDVGTVRLAGRSARAIGVDPSQFRGFTPPPTAASDGLWQNLADGDVAASYDMARKYDLTLGIPVDVTAQRTRAQRLGAFAAFGLPKVDVVVSRAAASALGLRPSTGVILSAPGRSSRAIVSAARDVLGSKAHIVALREDASMYKGKPRTYRALYHVAARTCPGLSWRILAAIGQVESGHGVNVGPSSAGALGPMQFMPGTWAVWARDGDGDRKADIMNPYDAVYAAAAYLCHNGAGLGGKDLERALFAYNHADWYVKDVLALARLYR
jgi:soluble lytic murein transglycosylase-like protein